MAPRISSLPAALLLLLVVAVAPPAARSLPLLPPLPGFGGGNSASRPKLLDADKAAAAPFRWSGRLLVTQKGKRFQGTATVIRRFTAVTAAHLLCAPNNGFSTGVSFQQELFDRPAAGMPDRRALATAVVAGYQRAADRDENSTDSFALDLGMVVFSVPAPQEEWAAWTVDPEMLRAEPAARLAVGYAAGSFEGTSPASVRPPGPFRGRRARYFTSDGYYTEAGMSGGPVYVGVNGDAANEGRGPLRAVVVSGTSYPDAAISGVRALGPEDRALFVEAEYANGLVTAGRLKGPAEVSAGNSYQYKAGVAFRDGTVEKKRYDELTLTAEDPGAVAVTKTGNDHFQVFFSVDLPSGSTVTLRLGRDTALDAAPVQRLTVKVR